MIHYRVQLNNDGKNLISVLILDWIGATEQKKIIKLVGNVIWVSV